MGSGAASLDPERAGPVPPGRRWAHGAPRRRREPADRRSHPRPGRGARGPALVGPAWKSVRDVSFRRLVVCSTVSSKRAPVPMKPLPVVFRAAAAQDVRRARDTYEGKRPGSRGCVRRASPGGPHAVYCIIEAERERVVVLAVLPASTSPARRAEAPLAMYVSTVHVRSTGGPGGLALNAARPVSPTTRCHARRGDPSTVCPWWQFWY